MIFLLYVPNNSMQRIKLTLCSKLYLIYYVYLVATVKKAQCNYRSSRPEVFCKKGVLKNFTKFTGKHLYQSLFFNKVAGLKPPAQVFPCEFSEVFKNSFFT